MAGKPEDLIVAVGGDENVIRRSAMVTNYVEDAIGNESKSPL